MWSYCPRPRKRVAGFREFLYLFFISNSVAYFLIWRQINHTYKHIFDNFTDFSKFVCHTKSLSDWKWKWNGKWKWKCNGKYAVIMTPYDVKSRHSTLVCATSKYLEQTNTHSNAFETAPVGLAGWRTDERGGGGVGLFFSRNDGITESGKKIMEGWRVSRNHSGWMAGSRRNIAGTGIQDLFRGLLYQGISTVFTGFCQLYWWDWETKLAEKVVTPYGNSPYTGGCSFNSYIK